MTTPPIDTQQFSEQILSRIDFIIGDCERESKPLEIDPARGKLFELFVAAESRGLVYDFASPDLSAEGICQNLAQRWGLQQAAQESVVSQSRMGPDELKKMRSLWSVMRMWMEWTYAWQRWPEFHEGSKQAE